MDVLLLVLGVPFDLAPDAIHEDPRVSEILLGESLEIKPRQGSYSILDSTLVLVPTETDLSPEERGREGGTVGSPGTYGVEMIFALLTEV